MPNWFRVIGCTIGIYTSPIWGRVVIQGLGHSVNRSVSRKNGSICTIEPYKFNYKPSEQYTMFENTLRSTYDYHWTLIFPPYTIFVFADVIKGIITFPIHVLTEGTV
jgi:hypothetical protein